MKYHQLRDIVAAPSFALTVLEFERVHSHELGPLVFNLVLQQFDQADVILAADGRLKANLSEGQKLCGGFVRALQGLAVQLDSAPLLDWLERHDLRMETREMGRDPSSMHPIVHAIEADNREMLAWYHAHEGKEAFAEELPSRTSGIAKAVSNPALFFWMLELEPALLNEPFYAGDWDSEKPISIDEYVSLKGPIGLSDQLRSFRSAQSALSVLNEISLAPGVKP